jgi:ADP-heptose:LPS heptosyltransferase
LGRKVEIGVKIAVLTLGGIGNLIMAYPMLHHLCRKFYDITIFTMNAGSAGGQLLEMLPVKVVVMPKDKGAFLFEALAYRHDFDMTITPFPGKHWSYRAWELVLGAKKRIGFDFDRLSQVTLTSAMETEKNMHDKEQNMKLLVPLVMWNDAILHETENNFIHHVWTKENDVEADFVFSRFKTSGKVIAIHPCSGKNPTMQRKKWGYYKQLIRLILQERPEARILLVGDSSEYELLPYYHVSPENIYMLWGYDIKTVAACLARCDLLIANESGVAHLADLVGCKSLVIVGQPETGRIKPFFGEIIQKGLDCQPCYLYPWGKTGYPVCDDKCLTELTAEEVMIEVKKHLGVKNETLD